MSWQHICLKNSLGSFKAEWDALNNRLYGGHPFNDSRFIEPLLNIFGSGRERLFICQKNGKVDGLIILFQRKPGVWRLFVPAQIQAVPLLVPNEDLIKEIFKFFPVSMQMLELLNQDPEFSPPGLFSNAPAKQIRAHALTMSLELSGSFESYWKQRSSNLTKNIRRYQNRLNEELGSQRLVIVNNPSEMPAAVARFGQLESSGWKGKVGTAVHADNEQGRFYSEILRKYSETGQANVYEYWFGDKLAASRLLISGGGMEIILKTSFDETLSRLAPGRLLLHALLKNLFAEKTQSRVEFYTNATQDQLAWATDQRFISHVTYFRHAWQSRLYVAFHRMKHFAKSSV